MAHNRRCGLEGGVPGLQPDLNEIDGIRRCRCKGAAQAACQYVAQYAVVVLVAT